ncbi:MAG: hypothetical protein K9I26_04800 [Flavobacterium sp.]|nr:hypothetical protein [Flavobacterium sp.]
MGLIDSILGFFVNRDIDKLQNSEEWIDLQRKVISAKKNMDEIDGEIDKSLDESDKLEENAKKMGLKPGSLRLQLMLINRNGHNAKGLKCLYCNSVIQSNQISHFCSVKCEKEYTEFKNK